MASIQYSGYTPETNRLSITFKALGHPARLAILEYLINEKRIPTKELVVNLPLSQSSVSGHLKILFESGILGYEKYQNVTYYVINPLVLESAKNSLKLITHQSFSSDYDYSRTFFNAYLKP